MQYYIKVYVKDEKDKELSFEILKGKKSSLDLVKEYIMMIRSDGLLKQSDDKKYYEYYPPHRIFKMEVLEEDILVY